MIALPFDLLSNALSQRAEMHVARYGGVLKDLRVRIESRFQYDVGRMRRALAHGPFSERMEVFVDRLTGYVGWLGWSCWCSSHLAPPLGLLSDDDINRIAAAMIVYAGPRLIDDALDDHRSYKGKRATLVGDLAVTHPHVDDATRRVHTALAGTWLILFGIERLRRHGGDGAANATLRLCERIAPGVLEEGLGRSEGTLADYERVIQMKSVRYDEILYRNLLEPCPDPLRSTILQATAHMSHLAQYLNDVSDYEADKDAGRPNVCQWLEATAVRARCEEDIAAIEALIGNLPDDVGNAVAASLNDTCRAAQRLSDTQRTASGDQA